MLALRKLLAAEEVLKDLCTDLVQRPYFLCFLRRQLICRINNLRLLRILSSSWLEPMPGSQTFCFNGLEGHFTFDVRILYEAWLRVNN